mgnify:CR=1 FL=1
MSGDKFTPAVHIFIDGRELPTRFINAQQLFTTVPMSLITNPGCASGRSPNARSNALLEPVSAQHNASASAELQLRRTHRQKPRYNDTAVLSGQEQQGDFLNVQRGDPVGTRFKVVSISERDVKLIDITLKIMSTIPFSTDQSSGGPYRPPARTVDDEPYAMKSELTFKQA